MKVLLIIFLVLGLCKYDLIAQDRTFTPKRIFFVSTTNVTDSSLDEIQTLIESAINKPDSFPSTDSLYNSVMSEFRQSMSYLGNMKKQIVIEFVKDTVWHHNYINWDLIGTKDTISTIVRLSNENINTEELQIDKKNRKQLIGFDCYKVTMERPKIYDMGVDEGNEIIEMYVTDLIKLPTSAIIHVNKQFPFFPLLIKKYNKRTPLHFTTTEAISIEK